MGSEVLAIATPFETTAGTWSGDVKLNTAQEFGLAGEGDYDLFSAMLHEAGHVFGLDHSENPASALYETYGGVRTGLSEGDIARLQALYGARTPDKFEGANGNGSFSTAASMGLSSEVGALQADGDLTTAGDVDFYRINS